MSAVGTACSGGPPAVAVPGPDGGAGEAFSFQTLEVSANPGGEVQDCFFVTVPDLASHSDLWVDKTRIATNGGNHHISVYRVKTIVALGPAVGAPFSAGTTTGTVVRGGECLRSPNWADWPLVTSSVYGGGPNAETVWALPAGVAHRFAPGESLMIQVHFLNLMAQPAGVTASVELYRTATAAPQELGVLFGSLANVRVCRSDPRPVFRGTCALPPGAAHIVAGSAHFHSRGQRASIFTWDGQSSEAPPPAARFYQSLSWDQPLFVTGLDLAAAAGSGFSWSCEYRWREPSVGCDAVDAADPRRAGDCCFTAGPSLDVNEHCNAFVYYWPKTESRARCGS